MGWQTVQFVEIDEFCQFVLNKNFPGVPVHGDLRTFERNESHGRIGILTAGYPCQPFSMAGQRRGKAMTPIFEHGGESERWYADYASKISDNKLETMITIWGVHMDFNFWDEEWESAARNAISLFQMARELERRQIERGKQV